jgi:hypothetical protein
MHNLFGRILSIGQSIGRTNFSANQFNSTLSVKWRLNTRHFGKKALDQMPFARTAFGVLKTITVNVPNE